MEEQTKKHTHTHPKLLDWRGVCHTLFWRRARTNEKERCVRACVEGENYIMEHFDFSDDAKLVSSDERSERGELDKRKGDARLKSI